MRARSRPLHLAGSALTGPLLVPSVSSKGFPIVDGISEAALVLPLAIQDIPDSLLLSAYDVHHGLLLESDRLLGGEQLGSLYAIPRLLIIDSGGYELSEGFESGETRRGSVNPLPFSRGDFEAVVDRLPTDRDLLVVTYDEPDVDRADYQRQREIAQQFAADRRHLRIDFLLKPPAGDRFIDTARLTPDAADLRGFDVIGVTEKELGDSLLDRLVCLAQLRDLLDSSDADAVPIHVFGSLDPILTPLYFMSGGEIFDGLSWLRYAYHEGAAIHPEELAPLSGSLEDNQVRRNAKRHLSNLHQLGQLKLALERWANEPERFDILGRHHERIREIHESVLARVGRRD